MATLTNTIKKAEKLSGQKITHNGYRYSVVVNGYEISFAQNGTDDRATNYLVKRVGESSDSQTDYFPGTFYENITQCFNSVQDKTPVAASVALDEPEYSLGVCDACCEGCEWVTPVEDGSACRRCFEKFYDANGEAKPVAKAEEAKTMEEAKILTKQFDRMNTLIDGKRHEVKQIIEHQIDLFFENEGRPSSAEWTFEDECEHIAFFFQDDGDPKLLTDYDGINDYPPVELLDWLRELGYIVPVDWYEGVQLSDVTPLAALKSPELAKEFNEVAHIMYGKHWLLNLITDDNREIDKAVQQHLDIGVPTIILRKASHRALYYDSTKSDRRKEATDSAGKTNLLNQKSKQRVILALRDGVVQGVYGDGSAFELIVINWDKEQSGTAVHEEWLMPFDVLTDDHRTQINQFEAQR